MQLILNKGSPVPSLTRNKVVCVCVCVCVCGCVCVCVSALSRVHPHEWCLIHYTPGTVYANQPQTIAACLHNIFLLLLIAGELSIWSSPKKSPDISFSLKH